MYAGNGVEMSPYYDGNTAEPAKLEDTVNTSPVNFFAPDMNKFKKYVHSHDDSVNLRRGDCLFIPAYYYYQFAARNMDESLKQDMEFQSAGGKSLATVVSLKYGANSHLLEMFMGSVERGIIR